MAGFVTKQPFKRVDVAYTVLFDEPQEKILMVKNIGDKGSYFTLPGGKVEEGETLQEGAIREVLEETGLSVKIGGLLGVCEALFEDSGHQAVFFTFSGRITGGDITLSMPEEIEQIVWMDIDEAKGYILGLEDHNIKLIDQHSIPYVFKGVMG
ncbi:NUDIX hydrolase [Fictibacillus iocasae]|uniref:NUDIX hydrolase n=1 Tax=Fictibacillus iocasae TaxID=2715437 RepID=A0ABW2NRM8_9BACL